MIVGIDEVGRGPWAGPLVFGAVVLGDSSIEGLTDSKKLTKVRRMLLDEQIRSRAKAWALGWVHANELDAAGLSEACRLACRRALEQITVPYDGIIIDGTVNFLEGTGKGPYVTTMKQADLLVPSVSAASVIAKVARDAFMADQDARYPGYGFGSHAGYGTKAHAAALARLGPSSLHRRSFAPVATFTRTSESRPVMNTAGRQAEAAAAEYLRRDGFEIRQQNWKTRWCEIDLVAERGGVIHFVEVKYRKNAEQGGGLAAITPSKLRRMHFAADVWFKRFGLQDATLSVMEVTGEDFAVTTFLERVTL